MSRIIVEATIISVRGKGLSRYAVNLLAGLSRVGREHEYLVLVDDGEQLPSLPTAANFRYVRVPARPRMKWLFRGLPRLLKETPHDLVHVVGELGPFWIPAPLVLTLTELPSRRHALQSRRAPREVVANAFYEMLFPICVRAADRLVAISAATKADVTTALRLDPGKTRVTPLAADEAFFSLYSNQQVDDYRARVGARDGYALAFATGDGRERIEFLLDVWGRVRASVEPPIRLVLAGVREALFRDRMDQLLRAHGLTDSVLMIGYVDEADLPLLYAAASCYIDTSIYEGFGLQSLEALAAGTPVVASEIPAIAEVVGSAATLVEPTNAAGFADAIAEVISARSHVAGAMEARRARARQFTWDDVALGTLRSYAEVSLPEAPRA